jgi:flagellum-specific peptidoglycan hydrolase FlgJ
MATNVQMAALVKVVPAAQTTARMWKVPASVTLAQWIFESTWGTSQLARQANNFFGIKRTGNDAYMEFPTHEVVRGRSVAEMAEFERYGTPVDSFAAHAHLLESLPRYAPCMAVAGDARAFAMQLGPCGYSTTPQYGEELVGAMKDYGLEQYDTPPPAQPAAAQEAA